MSIYLLIPANYTRQTYNIMIKKHLDCLDRKIKPASLLKDNNIIIPVKIGRSEIENNQRLLQHISTALCQGSIPPVILHKFKIKKQTNSSVTETNIINKCLSLGGEPMPNYKAYPYEAKETYYLKVSQLKKLIVYIKSITDSQLSVENIYRWAECKRELQRIKEEEGICKFAPY